MGDNTNNKNNSSSSEEEITQKIRKRYIRDAINPFEYYNDSDFKQRFRFTKNSVMHGILPLIKENLQKFNNRGLPIPPVLQLLICLRFYATTSFQVIIGNTFQVSQSTTSRIVERVSILIASNIFDYIKMPDADSEAYAENKRLFKELGFGPGAIGLPSINGAIDCTHVRLINTGFQSLNENFRNTSGYYSLNVQAVVGPRGEFMDMVPERAGGIQDNRIFQEFRIYRRHRNGEFDGMLVGDAGYSALPCLLTPITNPVTDDEICYNIIHERTREIVEKTFRIWKRRFPCLSQGLRTKLQTSTNIIMACAVLHNLALILEDLLEEEEDEIQHLDEVPVTPPSIIKSEEGLSVRNNLIERLFR